MRVPLFLCALHRKIETSCPSHCSRPPSGNPWYVYVARFHRHRRVRVARETQRWEGHGNEGTRPTPFLSVRILS